MENTGATLTIKTYDCNNRKRQTIKIAVTTYAQVCEEIEKISSLLDVTWQVTDGSLSDTNVRRLEG